MKQLVDVVPKYVNEAKPGKKYGSIKFADDGKYLVPAAMVKQFTANVPAKVEIDEQEWKDGPVTIVTKKVGDTGSVIPKQINRPSMAPSDARLANCSLIQEAYTKAGKIPLERAAIARARREILAGYDMSTSHQRADDLNDEIPDWPDKSENPASGIEDTL